MCVCVCVWRARLEGGVFECMTAGEIRREIVPVLEVILRGRNAWMCTGKRAYSCFYDCLLWLCLSGPCSALLTTSLERSGSSVLE